MAAADKYASHFTNRYGETWDFEYDPGTGEGVLRGSDVAGKAFRVRDGQVPELILNAEELRWLRNAWKVATGGNP